MLIRCTDNNLVAVIDYRLLPDRADRKNKTLRRIDDREKTIDAVAAKIGNRERPTLKLLRFHPLVARAMREILHRFTDFAQRFSLRRSNDGRNQPILDGDGKREIHVAVLHNRVVIERGVYLGTRIAASTDAFKTKSFTVIFAVSASSPADFNSARAVINGTGVDFDVQVEMRNRCLCSRPSLSAITLRIPVRLDPGAITRLESGKRQPALAPLAFQPPEHRFP